MVIRTAQSRNNRVVRFILCALERHLSGGRVDYNFTSDSFNIEHVLPQNPQTGWEAFTDEEVDALTYRLGNMTLMQAGANKDLGNTSYAAKRPVFEQSGFEITRKLAADHAEWTPERIATHQNWMAAQATAIWRIAQIG
ncbi:MAG: HNH endonuclease [Betaproteobacteria bacterium]|nr:HNH endonuclease [Betaproteobacteria bacterium]